MSPVINVSMTWKQKEKSMIKVGDIVRFSSDYIRLISSRRTRKYRTQRGKQELRCVTAIHNVGYDWRRRKHHFLVLLDNEQDMDITWLRFVRRPKKARVYRNPLVNACAGILGRRRRSTLSARQVQSG